jgi:hypothetical protein
MGVLVKARDVERQFRHYQAAQAAALAAEEVFGRACNERRPDAECQEAWARVGESVQALEREWQEYRRIAPARMPMRGKGQI